MDTFSAPGVTALAGFGVLGGLFLLFRGLDGYRSHARVADTSTSRIDSIAAGEVRVSGVVEAAELTLVSLVQSVPCVYYRATIADDDGQTPDADYTEERSIGFRVRDASGSLRVFPRGARIDAPVRFEGRTDVGGAEPTGLDLRRGGSTQTTELDHAAAVAELLRVREPKDWTALSAIGDRRGPRSYREARLEPGDEVTIVGRALPFADLSDPGGADLGDGAVAGLDDPEVAADLAEARAAGILADDPASAWGNAAIPGFGIGRPVVQPDIDPAADPLPLASAGEAARAERVFDIAPDTLVLAASEEVPLLIAFGEPGAVVERVQRRLVVGLLGAALAIVSAMVLAISVNGGFSG